MSSIFLMKNPEIWGQQNAGKILIHRRRGGALKNTFATLKGYKLFART